MLERLSLRVRLSVLLGAVLAVGLSIGAGLAILNARARIHAEAASGARLAHELVQTALASVEDSPDPEKALRKLLAGVEKLRHIRIFFEGRSPVEPEAAAQDRAPEWFKALVRPRQSAMRIALAGRSGLQGDVVIAADPADEIVEIWEEVVFLTLGGAGLALGGFIAVSMAVARTLRPVSALAEGLARLERGERSVRIGSSGPPEFVAIEQRVNALAAALERLDEENRALVARMIHVQDEERRNIARDLHDEVGPFLFTVRAGVGALARKLEGGRADRAELLADCARLDGQLDALQQSNRRILSRLRPAAFDEMGLAGALEALIARWREAHPGVAIELRQGASPHIGETIALTAYRIVQEGLTNVFRHSGATRVEIDVAPDGGAAHPELRVAVKDDGLGVDEAKEGLGLRGMSERVAALRGTLTLASIAPRGALLEARLPLG